MRPLHPLLAIVAVLALSPAHAAEEISGRDLCKQEFETYKSKLAKNPNDGAAWSELRVCADLLKRWPEATAIAEDAIARNVQRAEPHFIRGLGFYHMKEYARATESIRDAIRLNDKQAAYFFQLGLAYLHLNEPSEAVGAALRATELEPNNSAYHRQLAFAYFLLKEDEKSEASAKRALEIDQNDVAAYKILSNLYARQGRQTMADHMALESIRANGRIAKAHPFVPDKMVTTEELSPSPFKLATPPSHTEVFLRAQWERMKETAKRGDVEATVSFYSKTGDTQELYRSSLNKMGLQRMQDVFGRLGEISDCEVAETQASATCRCAVSGGKASLLETKVVFQKDADNIWRIKSF